jgi:hypothetical protein
LELEDLPYLALAIKIKEKEFLEGKSTLLLIQLEPGVAFILIVLINLVFVVIAPESMYNTYT